MANNLNVIPSSLKKPPLAVGAVAEQSEVFTAYTEFLSLSVALLTLNSVCVS